MIERNILTGRIEVTSLNGLALTTPRNFQPKKLSDMVYETFMGEKIFFGCASVSTFLSGPYEDENPGFLNR